MSGNNGTGSGPNPGGDGSGASDADRQKKRDEELKKCDTEYGEQYGEQRATADLTLAKSLDVCVELSKNPLTYAYDALKKPWGGDCLSVAQSTYGKSYDNARILREVC